MSEAGQKLIAAVRARAAANPDFVYEWPEGLGGCVNVLNGEGSCIVGCGALDSGLITAAYENTSSNDAGIYSLSSYLGQPFDDEELWWLEQVQCEQDSGTTWGEAVKMADDYLALRGYTFP